MNSRFKIGDLVMWNQLMGRVTDIMHNKEDKIYLYKLGTCSQYIPESLLSKVDFRDKVKLFKNIALC